MIVSKNFDINHQTMKEIWQIFPQSTKLSLAMKWIDYLKKSLKESLVKGIEEPNIGRKAKCNIRE
jgi:hypothetical protein